MARKLDPPERIMAAHRRKPGRPRPSVREVVLFCEAALLLMAARVALRMLPYRVLRGAYRARRRRGVPPLTFRACRPDEIGTAVRRAAARLRGTTCLPQAIAADLLLGAAGRPSRLVIGVARRLDGTVIAHAWVESDAVIIVGGGHSIGFTPFKGMRPGT